MKKNILIIAIAVMLLASFCFAEVSYDKSFVKPDLSLVKNIYKAQLRNLNFAQADRIVRNICGITGEPLILDNAKSNKNLQYYRTLDNQTSCQIDRVTGDILYRNHTKFQGSAPNLPAKDNALDLAGNYLMTLGLFKKGMAKPHISTLKDAVRNGQETETFEKMRVVTFTRTLDGIPVLGASRAAVMLGANGDLVGLVVRWMDVQPERITGKVATLAQLKNLIKRKMAARKLNVVVKKANLIMFDNGKGTMKPMIHLEGDLITSQGKFFSDWMIPVTK
ncbi:MAG: hypothetical protein KAT34_09765 [Candidatus Aminicenantes bacterium]|nr:hypothetical protein [Candidatus Aminicenantes bacterium]